MSNILEFEVSVKGTNASAQVDAINRKLKQMGTGFQDAGKHGVTNVQAISAGLRGLQDPMSANLRAVERFIAQSKVLSALAQNMFPLVGGLFFGKMLVDLGVKLADMIKQVNQAPKEITKAFQKMALDTESSTEQLRLHFLKTQDEINKIMGKPQTNGAAEALEEAKLAAIEYGKALSEDANKMKELMKANGVSTWGAFVSQFTGKGMAGTANAAGSISSFEGDLSDLGYKYAEAMRSGNKQVAADLQKQINDKMSAAQSWGKNTLSGFEASKNVQGALNPAANVAMLQGWLTSLSDRTENHQADSDSRGEDAKLKVAQANAEAARATKEWAEKFSNSGKELASKLEEMVNEYNRTPALIPARPVTGFFGQQFAPQPSSGLLPNTTNALKDVEADSRVREQNITLLGSLNVQLDKARFEYQAQMIEIQRSNGTLTAADAAQATSILHLQEYNDALSKLTEQMKNGDPVAKMATQRQIDVTNQNRQTQVATDNNSINATSLTYQLGQFASALQDTTSQLRNVIESTINGLNDDILSGKGFKKTGSDAFRSLGKMGLENVEGKALGALGIKGAGKLGTKGNPMYVTMDGATGAVKASLPNLPGFGGEWGSSSSKSSGGGGILSGLGSIAGKILGFAGGGDIDPSMGSVLVGELGPELVTPRSAGTVVPNKKAFGGGDTHNNITVNHSTDPAATHTAVLRALKATHDTSVKNSQQVAHEKQRRTPASARNR